MIRPIAKPVPRMVEKLIAKRDKAANMRRVRLAVLARDKGRCRCCGKRGTDLHHLKYRSQQGRDTESNCVLTCRKCHAAIHNHVLMAYGEDASTVKFEWHEAMRGLR